MRFSLTKKNDSQPSSTSTQQSSLKPSSSKLSSSQLTSSELSWSQSQSIDELRHKRAKVRLVYEKVNANKSTSSTSDVMRTEQNAYIFNHHVTCVTL